MNYYLHINDEVEVFDNELAYSLKIKRLRDMGFFIEYETAEGKIIYNYCYATK